MAGFSSVCMCVCVSICVCVRQRERDGWTVVAKISWRDAGLLKQYNFCIGLLKQYNFCIYNNDRIGYPSRLPQQVLWPAVSNSFTQFLMKLTYAFMNPFSNAGSHMHSDLPFCAGLLAKLMAGVDSWTAALSQNGAVEKAKLLAVYIKQEHQTPNV